MSDRATRAWSYPWMIYYAVALHIMWGGILMFDPAPLSCVALSPLVHVAHFRVVGLGLLSIALLAGLAMLPRFRDAFVGLLMVLPQQFALISSAVAATQCVFAQEYADGVERHWTFILSDQLPALLAMVLHTVALVDWTYYSRLQRKQGA